MKPLFTILLSVMIFMSCGRTAKMPADNPLVTEWDTPYGIPPFDHVVSAHYEPALDYAMAVHAAEIAAIADNRDEPSFENVVEAYDRSGELLSRLYNTFEMVCSADLDDTLAAAEERMMPRIAAHFDEILLNERLFAKIAMLYDKRGALSLDEQQLRLLEKTYDEFVRAGALLGEADKRRLKEINAALSLASVKYGSNLLAAANDYALILTHDQLDGLPQSLRETAAMSAEAAGHKGKYMFTLHRPSIFPFLTYSSRRELREEIYKAYLSRCAGGESDNLPLVSEMIRLRAEKAHLLGFESYAAYAVSNQMAGNTRAVYELLESIWPAALERAREELAEMETIARVDLGEERFESWDWWYYAERLRKRTYSLDEEMLRPYFSLDNVRHGIFFLANRLYGLTFRPVNVAGYNEECSAFAVSDSDDTHLGVLYFDFFTRAGKGGGAWCGYFREPAYDGNGLRTAPVVGIVCNFQRPADSAPALLTADDVTTLFHEFGHALHFLFSDSRYRSLLYVEGDFVELPSQIMENWAFEPDVLKNYAVHYRTDEVMPRQLVDKLRRSALFNQGFATTELVAAALSDMDIHSLADGDVSDPLAFESESLRERRGLIPQIEPRYRYPYFSHIFTGEDYASGYYYYVWANVLDKDAFAAFAESGDILDRRTAGRFRREILSRGGSADGMSMYRAFRGADPDRRPLLKARGLWNESVEAEEESAESHDENQPVNQ